MTHSIHLLRLLGLVIAAAVAVTAVGPAAAPAAKKKPRPSVKIVKREISKDWDTDGTGPNRTTLEFKKIKRYKTRKRHVNEFAPADIVTPVKAVFIQTVVYGDGPGMRDVARVTHKSLFYKAPMGWAYHQKGADVVYLERMGG